MFKYILFCILKCIKELIHIIKKFKIQILYIILKRILCNFYRESYITIFLFFNIG